MLANRPEDEEDGHEAVVEESEVVGLPQQEPLGEANDDHTEGERHLQQQKHEN